LALDEVLPSDLSELRDPDSAFLISVDLVFEATAASAVFFATGFTDISFFFVIVVLSIGLIFFGAACAFDGS
jgi:hypothetical protein